MHSFCWVSQSVSYCFLGAQHFDKFSLNVCLLLPLLFVYTPATSFAESEKTFFFLWCCIRCIVDHFNAFIWDAMLLMGETPKSTLATFKLSFSDFAYLLLAAFFTSTHWIANLMEKSRQLKCSSCILSTINIFNEILHLLRFWISIKSNALDCNRFQLMLFIRNSENNYQT